jgi:hypothetical protein
MGSANTVRTGLGSITPVKSPSRSRAEAHAACLHGRNPSQDSGSASLMRWISPWRAGVRLRRRFGTNGRRSARRLDLPRRIQIAMLLARFCWYSSPRSMVIKASKPALSATSSRMPFFCRRGLLRVGVAPMIRQAVLKLPGDTLVEENFHPSWPTSTDLASSRAEIAASWVTVGKSSRNSPKAWPPSR